MSFLRLACAQPINCGGKNVVPEVWEVLDKIKGFSDKVPCLPLHGFGRRILDTGNWILDDGCRTSSCRPSNGLLSCTAALLYSFA